MLLTNNKLIVEDGSSGKQRKESFYFLIGLDSVLVYFGNIEPTKDNRKFDETNAYSTDSYKTNQNSGFVRDKFNIFVNDGYPPKTSKGNLNDVGKEINTDDCR